jgi:hypothetical protein
MMRCCPRLNRSEIAVNLSIDTDVAADAPGTLEAQCRLAEREATAALVELSARMFIHPGLHDGMRSSPAFQYWQACRERAQQLRARLDATQGEARVAA